MGLWAAICGLGLRLLYFFGTNGLYLADAGRGSCLFQDFFFCNLDFQHVTSNLIVLTRLTQHLIQIRLVPSADPDGRRTRTRNSDSLTHPRRRCTCLAKSCGGVRQAARSQGTTGHRHEIVRRGWPQPLALASVLGAALLCLGAAAAASPPTMPAAGRFAMEGRRQCASGFNFSV